MLTGFSRTSCSEVPKHPAGPSAPGRRRTCPPRTALSSRPLGRDRHLLEVRDVPVAHRSPRSVCLTVGRGSTSALARALSEPPLLHESRDLLAKGCAQCTKAPTTRSTPHPSPVVPGPRGVLRGPAPAPHRKDAHVPWAATPENLSINDADAAASRVGCCGVGGRLDGVEGGVQPRVTWRARGSPGGGSAWWRSAGGSP